MNKPTIPTAEEFWELTSPNEDFGMLAELKRMNLDRHVFESMRRFAKIHVDAALKCAAESAEVVMTESCSDHTPYWGPCGTCGSYSSEMIPTEYVDKESILNSYDLNNIK